MSQEHDVLGGKAGDLGIAELECLDRLVYQNEMLLLADGHFSALETLIKYNYAWVIKTYPVDIVYNRGLTSEYTVRTTVRLVHATAEGRDLAEQREQIKIVKKLRPVKLENNTVVVPFKPGDNLPGMEKE